MAYKTPKDVLENVLEVVEKHGGVSQAAKALNIPRTTLASQHKAAKNRLGKNEPPPPELPTFPDEDIPVEDIIDTMSRRFEKRSASYKAHTWFPVKFKTDDPVGILWVGDPHVDDNGCNWPVLKRHAELCQTEGVYAVNIGDTTNNWSGRLAKLYAEQDSSISTARKLAEWLMLDSGIHWLVWLIGNHDAWGDGAEVLAQMAKRGTKKLVCHDWEARFRLCFPGGWDARVFAAHDFKGHSQWNPLHGPMKAGQMGPEADIYVCGHKHNWAQFTYENASRGREQHFIRVRGYKFLDEYARRLGIIEQEGGCSMLTVFDPSRESITTFSDVERGVEFLNVIRKAIA